jgi:anti-anti-sigma factor
MNGLLTLASRMENGCVILEANGEFTRHQRGRFVGAIKHAIGPGVQKVIVEASGLTQISPSALAELAEVHCMLADGGCRLVLVNLAAQVRKMLVLSFLDKVIATAPTVEAALAWKFPAGPDAK